VDGWDDPRMPTISGLRRRGYSPAGIRGFCKKLGVTKYKSTTDMSVLEQAVRDDLNKSCPRFMGVLHPIKVVLTNWPAGQVEEIEAVNNPEDPSAGSRVMKFSGELYIEQDDFSETPPPKYMRLAPGREVRLRYAYNIRCDEVVKDADGKVIEIRCTCDMESRHSGPKKGSAVIHWLSAPHAATVEVRLYDRLFTIPDLAEIPDGKDYRDYLNPDSLVILPNAKVEPLVKDIAAGERFQFERLGYFCVDGKHSRPGAPVLNRTVTLKDTWAKVQAKA